MFLLSRLIATCMLVFLVAGCSRVQAMGEDTTRDIPLTGRVAMLRDPHKQLDIDQVAHSRAFAATPPDFNLGYIPDAVWLRLHLSDLTLPQTGAQLQVDAPLADTVQLYIPDGRGGYQRRQQGGDIPPSDDAYLLRTPVFDLSTCASHCPDVYLRLTERNAMSVGLRLWSTKALIEHETIISSQMSVFIGLITALCLVGALLWRYTHAGPVGWYLAYVFSISYSIVKTRGLPGPFFHLSLPNDGDTLLGVILAVGMSTAVSFSFRLMKLYRTYPRAARIYESAVWLISLCCCVGFMLGHFGDAMLVTQMLGLFNTTCMLAVSIWLTTRGSHHARLYLIAFSTLYLAFYEGLLYNLGVLPQWELLDNDAPLVVGLTLHLALLTLGFAQRMHRLERQKAEAQQLALQASLAAEASLEQKVRERTRELDEEVIQRRSVEQALRDNEQQLRHSLDVEREARENQRDFVAMVSHEFRTPLAIIDASGQMIQATQPDLLNANLARLEKIQKATDRMSDLIGRFLDNERLLAHSPTIHPEPLAPEQLIATIVHTLDPERQHIDIDVSAAPHTVVSDRECLRIVLDNLLGNALKYSPSGHRIQLRVSVDDGALRIDVSDHGPGIPSTERTRIFAKFVRGAKAGATAGAGLGLYMVRRLAEMLGGRVSLDSNDGGGNTFSVFVPLDGPVPRSA